MDIINIISKTPGLLDALKGNGLSSDQVAKIGGEVTQQLREGGEFDLTDLLAGLDIDSFTQRVDVGALAEKVGMGNEQADAVLQQLAPAVQAFTGDGDSLLGNLASGLWGRD